MRPVEHPDPAGEKTAEAIRQEIAREVNRVLRVAFQDRQNTGRLDVEAIEMALRSAMHHAGTAAPGELLNFDAPPAERRIIPCSCGHQAHYQELRSKPVLTAVGHFPYNRPYATSDKVTPIRKFRYPRSHGSPTQS